VVAIRLLGEHLRGELGDVAHVDHSQAAFPHVQREGSVCRDAVGRAEQVLHEEVGPQDRPAHSGLLHLAIGQRHAAARCGSGRHWRRLPAA